MSRRDPKTHFLLIVLISFILALLFITEKIGLPTKLAKADEIVTDCHPITTCRCEGYGPCDGTPTPTPVPTIPFTTIPPGNIATPTPCTSCGNRGISTPTTRPTRPPVPATATQAPPTATPFPTTSACAIITCTAGQVPAPAADNSYCACVAAGSPPPATTPPATSCSECADQLRSCIGSETIACAGGNSECIDNGNGTYGIRCTGCTCSPAPEPGPQPGPEPQPPPPTATPTPKPFLNIQGDVHSNR